jgi:hypothetical protein
VNSYQDTLLRLLFNLGATLLLASGYLEINAPMFALANIRGILFMP